MAKELEQALRIPIQLVPMEQLGTFLDQSFGNCDHEPVFYRRSRIDFCTAFGASYSRRYLRLCSGNPVSGGFAERQLFGFRQPESGNAAIRPKSSSTASGRGFTGDDGLWCQRPTRLNSIVRSARTIFCDQPSFATVKAAINAAREDIIRPPQLICSENYIGSKSINLLKRELGLG